MKIPDYQKPTDESMEKGHEVSDVSARLIAVSAFGLVLLVVASMWMLHVALPLFARKEPNKSVPTIPPEPRLQANPAIDLDDLHRKEDAILNNYQWIDRENNIVSVPIEEAMQQVVAEGFPVREEEME